MEAVKSKQAKLWALCKAMRTSLINEGFVRSKFQTSQLSRLKVWVCVCCVISEENGAEGESLKVTGGVVAI